MPADITIRSLAEEMYDRFDERCGNERRAGADAFTSADNGLILPRLRSTSSDNPSLSSDNPSLQNRY